MPPTNGVVDTSSGTTAGSVAFYSCDQGRILTGSAARVCGSNGLWTPATPSCNGIYCYCLSNVCKFASAICVISDVIKLVYAANIDLELASC